MQSKPWSSCVLLATLACCCAEADPSALLLDGILSESTWDNAEVIDDFITTQPRTFASPDYVTEVRVATDDAGIYVSFLCQQSADERVNLTTLDDVTPIADYVEVILDFDAGGRRAFGFKVSHQDAVQDSVWHDENLEVSDWDGDWQHAVSSTADSWTVEIFIPWSIAPSAYSENKQVGMYLSRWDRFHNQRYSYPGIDRSQNLFMSEFAEISVIAPTRSSLEVFPYFRVTEESLRHKPLYKAGIDVFSKWNNANQINLSINPDFGQVESDELVVNFSAIETFFSEKRPFFSQNHELFDLRGPESLRLVHTPRIGAAPDVGKQEASGIDAAIRYAHFGRRFDTGLLMALEEEQNGVLGRTYLATRWLGKWDHASAGGLFTYTERPGLDKKALVSVVDFKSDQFGGLLIQGQLLRSDIEQKSHRQHDTGWWISGEFEPTDNWSHALVVFRYGDLLDLNDFGFVKRIDRKQLEYETQYRWPAVNKVSWLRDLQLFLEIEARDNLREQGLSEQVGTGIEMTLLDTSELSFEFELQRSGVDDLMTRGNNPVFLPRQYALKAEYNTRQRGSFHSSFGIGLGEEGLKGRFYEISIGPSYQILPNLSAELVLSFVDSHSWLNWESANLLGEYKRQELGMTLNVSFTHSDRHEMRLKAEAIALKAELKQALSAGANGYMAPANVDLESIVVGEFAAQLRYRYRLSRQSEIFLVYSRGGEIESEELGVSFRSIANSAVNQRGAESFLFKVKLQF